MVYNKYNKNCFFIFIMLITLGTIYSCQNNFLASFPVTIPSNYISSLPAPAISVPPPFIPVPNAPFGE